MSTPRLRIVSSNNVEVFRHLGAAQLKRADIEHVVGSDMAEIRELVAKHQPTLVMIDAELADGNGYDLCREIKSGPCGRETHVIILHNSIMTMEQLSKSAASGCDDVLALPMHADDFYCHLSQVTGVSLRDSFRVGVEMEVLLHSDNNEVRGKVTNLGTNGLGVQVDSSQPLGPVGLSVVFDGTTYDGIQGEIVWCNANQRGYAIGVRLAHLPAVARGLLARLALFQITEGPQGQGITVAIQGVFDEQTDFNPLLARLKDERVVDFMMQGITYVGSQGVRSWCIFLGKLHPETKYTFRNCSVAFASQASMVPMAIAKGTVISVQAPYLCETCDREETRLVESASVLQGDRITPPMLHCHICSNQLVFDDLPERYFAFLHYRE